MNTKIFSLLALAAMTVGTTSCHEDIIPDDSKTLGQEGSINLRSMGVEINNAEKVITTSRAAVDLSDFIIDITDTDGAAVNSWTYSNMPELFSLPVGEYTVKVRSHEVQKAEWEHPYFVGEQSFSIVNDEITEIGVVTCSLASIKVTVDYTDELRAVMGSDCKVVVKANDEGSLEYSASETRAGYFEALEGSTTLVAEFTGTVDGNEESLNVAITDVEAGQHRKITFKLHTPNVERPDENGSISVDGGVKLDVAVEDENLSGNVTVEEEILDSSDRPGKEENGEEGGEEGGDTPDTPSVVEDITYTSSDVSFDEANDVNLESCVVLITADKGIEHLVVTIESSNSNFLISLNDLDVPTTFDLAYPGDKADVYKGSLGLPVGNEVIGATSINFDISQFVPLLSAFEGTHKFQISTTDSDGHQLIKTLTFVSK